MPVLYKHTNAVIGDNETPASVIKTLERYRQRKKLLSSVERQHTSFNLSFPKGAKFTKEMLEASKAALDWAIANQFGVIKIGLSLSNTWQDRLTIEDSTQLDFFKELLEYCVKNSKLHQGITQLDISNVRVKHPYTLPDLSELRQCQNQIAQNQRAYYAQHLGERPQPEEPRDKSVSSAMGGRKKRKRMNLNTVSVDINAQQEEEQEQEQEQEQERDEQLEIAQERQTNIEALHNRESEIPERPAQKKEDYLSREEYLDKGIRIRGGKEIKQLLWDAMTGSVAIPGRPKIVGISESVAELMNGNVNFFKSGLSMDPLPPGFRLYTDESDPSGLLLDYSERQYEIDLIALQGRPNIYPSIRKCVGVDIPWVGDERQFPGLSRAEFECLSDKDEFEKLTKKAQLDLFLKLIKSESPGFLDSDKEKMIKSMFAVGIKDLHAGNLEALGLFPILSQEDLYYLGSLVNKYGAKGLVTLLSHLDQLRQQFGYIDTKEFFELYIRQRDRNGSPLVSDYDAIFYPGKLEALSTLRSLTPKEFQLFLHFSRKDLESQSNISIDDTAGYKLDLEKQLKNFIIFKDELKKLSINLETVDLTKIECGRENMDVMMQRILTITKKSIDPITQFKYIFNLDGRDSRKLPNDEAYQAITEEGYFLVTRAMAFHSPAYDVIRLKLESLTNRKFNTTLSDFLYLRSLTEDELLYNGILFLRLVGKSYNADQYLAYAEIENHFSNSLGRDRMEACYALALTAFATIHDKAFKINPDLYDVAHLKMIALSRRGIDLEIVLSYLSLADNPEVVRPQFEQLGSLLDFHAELGPEHHWNKDKEHCLKNAANLGPVFFEAIHNRVTSSKNIARIAGIFYDYTTRPFMTSEVKRLMEERSNLFKVIALCDDIMEDPYNQITHFVGHELALMDFDVVKMAFSILSSVKFRDSNSKQLSFDAVQAVLKDIHDSKVTSYAEILKKIQEHPGFSGCVFDKGDIGSYNGKSAKNLIQKYIEDVKDKMKQFNIPWDNRYEADPKLLIAKVLELAKSNSVVKLGLNALSSQLIGLMKKQLLQKLSSEAEFLIPILDKKLKVKTGIDDLEESLDILTQYEGQANTLIELLEKIKRRNPVVYKNSIRLLKQELLSSSISLESLNNLMNSLFLVYQEKFPTDVLETILSHSDLKNEIISEVIIPLIRNQQIGLNKRKLNPLIQSILTFSHHNVSPQDINRLLYLLNNNTQTKQELFKMIGDIAQHPELSSFKVNDITKLIALAEKTPELRSKFYEKFGEKIGVLNRIAKANFSEEQNKQVLMILSKIEYTAEELESFVNKLEKMNDSDRTRFLSEIAGLSIPFIIPHPDIKEMISSDAETIINNIAAKVDNIRNNEALLDARFSTKEVPRVLEKMGNLIHDIGFNFTQKHRLQRQFSTLNYLGRYFKLAHNKPIKNMEDKEIQDLLAEYRTKLSGELSFKHRQETRLIYLALLRESMFRATGKMPYSTQMMTVLNAMNQGDFSLSEVQTGEGKSMMAALMNALLHAEGYSIHIATMNDQLTRANFGDNKSFYDYIGVKANVITEDSDLNEIQADGINYFEVSALALIHGRAAIEGFEFPKKVSLILDEADYTLLDDRTQYRYVAQLDSATPTHNVFAFVYSLINDFIDDNTQGDEEASVLRRYLVANADPTYARILLDDKIVTDKQLNLWLDSATAAKDFYKERENIDWVLKTENRNGKPISVAKLIINHTPSRAKWSNGVQQFVHARINKAHALDIMNNQFPAAPIDAERRALTSFTAKNIIDFYKKRGKIWGMTGTIGSLAERLEQAKKFGFKLFSTPPHNESNLMIHPAKLVSTNKQKYQAIFDATIRSIRKHERAPALNFCEDPKAAKEMYDFFEKELSKKKYKKYRLRLQLLSGSENRVNVFDGKSSSTNLTKEEAITQGSLEGCITIATPMVARGTDFKPKKRLFTTMSYIDIERTTRQAVGRSGRQGQEGEAMIIVSEEDLHKALEKEGIAFSTSIFKRKKLATYIKEIQAKRNYSAKEQLQQIEVLGDIRNIYFKKLLKLIDKKPHNEKIELLKKWEMFLLELDLEKAKQLNGPKRLHLNRYALNILAFADKAWHDMDEKSTLLSKQKLREQAYAVVMHPTVIKALDTQDVSTKLPEPNVAKLVCESLETPDQALVDEALRFELELINKELLEIFKKNRVPKDFYPNPQQGIEKSAKELYRVLYLQIARNPKGYKLEQYNKLRIQLNNAVQWHDERNVDPASKLIINHSELIDDAHREVAKVAASKKALTFSFGKNKDKGKKSEDHEEEMLDPDKLKPQQH